MRGCDGVEDGHAVAYASMVPIVVAAVTMAANVLAVA